MTRNTWPRDQYIGPGGGLYIGPGGGMYIGPGGGASIGPGGGMSIGPGGGLGILSRTRSSECSEFRRTRNTRNYSPGLTRPVGA